MVFSLIKTLGKNIKKHRAKINQSQEMLALATYVDVKYIRKIELGRANPSFRTIFRISSHLKTKISDLVKGM